MALPVSASNHSAEIGTLQAMPEKDTSKSALRAEIGTRLKEERDRLGLKAADFGQFGDWPVRTVYGWEAGKATPKAEFFADVEALGLDVNYIITGRRTAGSLTGPAPAPASDADTIRIPLIQRHRQHGQGQ